MLPGPRTTFFSFWWLIPPLHHAESRLHAEDPQSCRERLLRESLCCRDRPAVVRWQIRETSYSPTSTSSLARQANRVSVFRNRRSHAGGQWRMLPLNTQNLKGNFEWANVIMWRKRRRGSPNLIRESTSMRRFKRIKRKATDAIRLGSTSCSLELRSRPDPHKVLFIKLDGIGDFIIWIDAARALVQHYRDQGKSLILVADAYCAGLAEALNIFDQVILLINNDFLVSSLPDPNGAADQGSWMHACYSANLFESIRGGAMRLSILRCHAAYRIHGQSFGDHRGSQEDKRPLVYTTRSGFGRTAHGVDPQCGICP